MNAPTRLTRTDAAVAALLGALTLAVAVYFAPRGFQQGFVDMGHDGYQLRLALDLAGGGVVFKNTFDQYGPLNGYLNTAGFLALGHRLLAMKYFICGWYAAIAVALFFVARRFLSTGLAAFSVLAWLALAPFANHGIMISPHVYALLFQAVGVLVLLRTERPAAGAFAVVGVLGGLSWAVKQPLGILFVAAVAAYVVARAVLERDSWRGAIVLLAALFAGCGSVIAAGVGFLWTQGALHDWYLQTVVFPREFYLLNAGAAGEDGVAGAAWRILDPFVQFARQQVDQPWYWIFIRATVLLTAAFEVYRRRIRHELLLMGAVTFFLWFGAYPSGNFMHQWWTSSLTIPLCVYCIGRQLSRWAIESRVGSAATMAIVLLVISPGVAERASAAVVRARTLTDTLARPAVFRGIRTDPGTKRAFELLSDDMESFRAAHPGARVVSIETADGWSTGMVETLPLLSFLDGNTHRRPVYWSLPVLSTVVYPKYRAELWQEVADEHPLIVDHRYGPLKPWRICGYQLLAALPSDFGHWYLYEPAGADDRRSARCVADDTGRYAVSPRPSVDGAYRGRITEAAPHLASVSGASAVDAPPRASRSGVDLYTWPADAPVGMITRTLQPLSSNVAWQVGRGTITSFGAGSWTVEGATPRRFSYLLQWSERRLAAGTLLVLRGTLEEGGLQVGFTSGGKWAGFVIITSPGPFEARLEVQETGQYGVIVANCVRSSWPARVWTHPIGATLGLLVGGYFPNRSRVTEAGWIAPTSGDANRSPAA